MNYGTEVDLLGVMECWDFDESDEPHKRSPEYLVELAGRTCYDSVDKIGTNPDWIQARIKQGHESIIEHVNATFRIRCSRVVSHQLVRHRIASYSQKSQRVKEKSFEYITPPELEDNQVFEALMNACEMAYNEFIEQGISPDVARYVFPNATKTEIIMTMNFRSLRNFIKQRTDKAALPEMREVAYQIKDICMSIAPKVFEDLNEQN
jgi:thymidylate synthase (FAD)